MEKQKLAAWLTQHTSLPLIVLCLTLLLGGYLRFTAARESLVMDPYRADAAQYYNSAYNLRMYGIYSHDWETVAGTSVAPKPDAFVTPGYPLFLSLFADAPPSRRIFTEVTLWQAALGTASILLAFLLFRRITRPWVAVLGALLVAISPHLVVTGIYLLSETLFVFLLLLTAVVLTTPARNGWAFRITLLATGLLMGVAALTRPVLEFFPILMLLLLFSSYPRRQAAMGAGLLLLGFALVWSPWIARNHISIGKGTDTSVMVSTLASGMYPDMEYDHRPETRGFPYRFDPRFPEITSSLSSTLTEIMRRFRENPVEELEWYLVGKPVTLWSWDIFEGQGDVFIYPTLASPYDRSPLFVLSHSLMHGLHWLLVLLAFGGCVLVWHPAGGRCFSAHALFCTRLMSLLLLYNTAVLMILAPFVRYSITFLPLQYGMAACTAAIAFDWLRAQRARSLERHRAGSRDISQ